eukprot:10382122-Lingulodinium_polyedra.AAC.1
MARSLGPGCLSLGRPCDTFCPGPHVCQAAPSGLLPLPHHARTGRDRYAPERQHAPGSGATRVLT